MNTDYILKGKNQPALYQPDWAGYASAQPAGKQVASDDTQTVQKTANNATIRGSKKSFGPDVDTVDVTFNDLLDTLNPMQHIPIVNMIYREMTGDKISGVAQVAGSALYGGPLGIISGVIDAIFEQEKGGSAAEVAVASLFGSDKKPVDKIRAPETMIAQKPPEKAAPVAVAENTIPESKIPENKIAEKQPFGGIMAKNEPAANEEEAAEKIPAALPKTHKPIEVEGDKFYSLAGVIRHGNSDVRMPLPDSPDVRLKSFNQKSIGVAQKTPAINEQSEEALLGLSAPTIPLAAAPGFSPLAMPSKSGNPLPPELIQDMMLMNMQKYQDGLKNGTMRGNTLDVEG